jgi:hypothetical protein
MLGKAGHIRRPPGPRVDNPICQRCGGMRCEYSRLNRRHLGMTNHRNCCCQCDPCVSGSSITVTFSDVNASICTGCAAGDQTYSSLMLDGSYSLSYPGATTAGDCGYFNDFSDITYWGNLVYPNPSCTGAPSDFSEGSIRIELTLNGTTENISSMAVIGGTYVRSAFEATGLTKTFGDTIANQALCSSSSVVASGGTAVVTCP